ncbi:hypothetical protein IGJ55_003207 [Enterococcus sp. AZ170]
MNRPQKVRPKSNFLEVGIFMYQQSSMQKMERQVDENVEKSSSVSNF